MKNFMLFGWVLGFVVLGLIGESSASILYVDANSATPVSPYSTWTTAATNIQDAVDVAVSGDTVSVTNGHYLLSSEILVNKNITIQSVNGAGATIVDGGGTTRCFNLGSSACIISGLTIQNGYTLGHGGGAYCSDATPVVSNCIISSNSARWYGGGMYLGTANNCTISGNSADAGGGMFGWETGCTANNCTIIGNSARLGGGIYFGTANNCTISGNSAAEQGGGMRHGTASNCIIWYNMADYGANLLYTTATNSCSSDVAHGVDGNITNAPFLVSSSHIASNSPCRGAGSAAYATGADIDGEAWLNPPSMGCDEYYETTVLDGPIHLELSGLPQKAVVGSEVPCLSTVIGKVSSFQVDFGNGHVVSNSLLSANAWGAVGDYNVVLFAYNTDYPTGVSITQNVEVITLLEDAIHVSQATGNDANDGLSWATPKATIQAGVDAQDVHGGMVWVSNGTYAVTSQIKVDKSIVIQSVNGAAATIVDGGGTVRCFSLGGSACIVSGFTIQNGYSGNGGGIFCSDTTPVVNNCVIRGNRALYVGAGMRFGTANNCTITGNLGAEQGGGVFGGIVNNCIVWYNITGTPANNMYDCIATHTCSPDAIHGVDGNITNAPLLASSSHISTDSPCRGAGSSLHSSGVDVDGEPWLDPSSLGCDEVHVAGSVTGLVDVAIDGDFVGVASHPLELFADIHGAVTMHAWDFGDGTGATNNPYPTHAWAVPGSYNLILTVFNDTYPAGVSATQVVEVVSLPESAIHVSVQTGNDANDGSNWATAKATIQAGVDAQVHEGGIVWVSNGVYNLTSEITVDKSIVIQSVEGRDATIVDGGGVTRCFTLAGRFGILEGFTIQNGNVSGIGGGIYCKSPTPIIEDCMISSNSANHAGGIHGGTVHNCTITGNSALWVGGGMNDATAYNCIITGNSASEGGGMDIRYGGGTSDRIGGSASHCIITGNTAELGGGILGGIAQNCLVTDNQATDAGGGTWNTMAINCTISDNVADLMGGGSYKTILRSDCNTIVYYNTAPQHADLYSVNPTTNCCASDIVDGIDGGITAEPMFVDRLAGNYLLQSNSPCINWGSNASVEDSLDLSANPRIVETYVDIGCYEYQDILGLTDSDNDGLLDEWERLWFGGNILPDGNADGDTSSNGEEYIAGTDPTNSASYFHVTTTTEGNPSQHIIINWEAATGRVYNVLWTPSLMESFQLLEVGIQYPQNSYTDTVHAAESSGYYRVVVMRADYDIDGDGLPNDWESQYAVADAYADGDSDGFNNLAEFISGTDPTNGMSYFTAANSVAEVSGTNYFVVEWISIPDRLYSVQWSTNLMSGFQTLETSIEHPQSSYTDTTHNAESAGYYKVDVRLK